MSGQATGWVLRHGPRDRAMRYVLLAIADAANRDGEHAHPGIAAIIEGSLYSRAHVLATIARLVEEGWLEVEEEGGGRGRATVYRIVMERVQSPGGPHDLNGPVGSGKGSNPAAETVQSTAAAPLSTTVKPNGKEQPPTSSGRRAKIPDDFAPSSELLAWAADAFPAIDARAETAFFVDYWRSRGEARADWPAGWRNWIRNADRFRRERTPATAARKAGVAVDDDRSGAGGLLEL